MTSVCVLALNGRRQTVKCTPNTTILQILEEVCRKQGLNPEEYDLKHHKRVLDTSTSFRFSGLPNNAQLELVNATKTRAETEITIALTLESGERRFGEFISSNTLYDVLLKLSPENTGADKNPTVTYMIGSEYYGNQLKKTTLKELGLSGGKAVLRLINRSPEQLKNQANVSAPIVAKPVEEKPYHRSLKTPDSPPRVPQPLPPNTRRSDARDKSHEHEERKPFKPQTKNDNFIKLAKQKEKSKSPSPEVHVIKSKNSLDQKNINSSEDTVELMEVDSPKKYEKKPPAEHPVSNRPIEEEFNFIGDRYAMLFSLETFSSVQNEDLPDEFFDLDVNDARKILRDIRKNQTDENSLLKTAEMREREENEKLEMLKNRYKKVIIRIQFPNRIILQGIFNPDETVNDVMNFVKDFLQDQHLRFYLYTAPPKNILDPNESLLEAKCIPQALVHFGTGSADPSELYIREDLDSKYTTGSKASLAASRLRQQFTVESTEYRKPDNEVDESMDVVPSTSHPIPSTSRGTSSENYGSRKITASTDKIPKWFKPPK